MIGDILLARLTAIPQVALPQTPMGFNAYLPQETLVEAEPFAVEQVAEIETEVEVGLAEDAIELAGELPIPLPPSLPMGIALRMAETPIAVQDEPLPPPAQEEGDLLLPKLVETVVIKSESEPKAEASSEPLEIFLDVPPALPNKVAVEQEQPPLQSKPFEHKAIEKIQIAPAPEPLALSLSTESLPQPDAPASESLQVIDSEPLVEKREVFLPQKAAVPPLVRNVMERMEALQIEPGKTKVLLRPDGLGMLEIDLTQAADGQMQLVIRVENPMVLDALRQESTHLANFMGAKGFDLAGGEPQLDHYEAQKKQSKDESDDLVEDEDIEVNQQLGADSLNIMT